MAQLGMPTLFCHTLETDAQGIVTGYRLRIPDRKRARSGAARPQLPRRRGGRLVQRHRDARRRGRGILFRPPQNVIDEFPQFPVVRDYAGLTAAIADASRRIGE